MGNIHGRINGREVWLKQKGNEIWMHTSNGMLEAIFKNEPGYEIDTDFGREKCTRAGRRILEYFEIEWKHDLIPFVKEIMQGYEEEKSRLYHEERVSHAAYVRRMQKMERRIEKRALRRNQAFRDWKKQKHDEYLGR
jgi:hypothetical protein